ncbi:hypothetical protein [Lentibacillus sediminis]|uniref:hypothetical protein n=1 Tax=Lentibacillus sediminis TaxID=1940529 RepID=UPI000C1BC589|nr:hypothetical protein [Lentibacillus sediminis]
MKGLLMNSLGTKQKLELIYIDGEGNISHRVIRVLEIREDAILAYCYRKREVRLFKLENILSAGAVRKRQGA